MKCMNDNKTSFFPVLIAQYYSKFIVNFCLASKIWIAGVRTYVMYA